MRPRRLDGPRHSRQGGTARAHMQIRETLFRLAHEILVRDQLADFQLAGVLRTSEPRARDLIAGRHIERFNSETLIDILARLGVDIDIVVTNRRPYLHWNFRNPRPGWRPPPGFAHG